MIHSMTGFGKHEYEYQNKRFTIELKSLNNKNTDIFLRLPSVVRDKEIHIRKEIMAELYRGKIECHVTCNILDGNSPANIDQNVALRYIEQLRPLISKLDNQNITECSLQAVLRLPEVIKSDELCLEDNEWTKFKEGLALSLDNINAYRKDEGVALHTDISNNIEAIDKLRIKLQDYDTKRIDVTRQKLIDMLKKLDISEGYNEERLEQELVFYIEKYDINEENIRLEQHCKYFVNTMNETPCGKKLGFIAQEIGREINTIGSKANSQDITRIIVEMKDHLERIKEQVLNIL
ncbi:MAG: YicC/YloC family endoribonuclease [Bacteroidales bacterium]